MVKNVRFFEDFSHVAQNLCNFAHVSVFKNIAPFAFYSVLKVMTFLSDPDVGSETGLHKLRSATAASHILSFVLLKHLVDNSF